MILNCRWLLYGSLCWQIKSCIIAHRKHDDQQTFNNFLKRKVYIGFSNCQWPHDTRVMCLKRMKEVIAMIVTASNKPTCTLSDPTPRCERWATAWNILLGNATDKPTVCQSVHHFGPGTNILKLEELQRKLNPDDAFTCFVALARF